MASGSGPKRRPDPWERLDAETDPAWAAFIVYRDAGLERSIAKVAKDVGKSRQLLHRWSANHSWVIRAAAWDREEDKMRVAGLRAAHHRNGDRKMSMAGGLLQVASSALFSLGQDEARVKSLKAADIARLADVAVKLEASVMQATLGAGAVGSGIQGATRDHVEHLTDEDRIVRMRQLLAELTSRLNDYETQEAS